MENDNEPSCPVCRTSLITQHQNHRQKHRPYPPDTYPPNTLQDADEAEEAEEAEEAVDLEVGVCIKGTYC